jgi:hypothetical protein
LQWQSLKWLKGDMILFRLVLLPSTSRCLSSLTPVIPDSHGFQQQPEAILLLLLEVEVEPLVVQFQK